MLLIKFFWHISVIGVRWIKRFFFQKHMIEAGEDHTSNSNNCTFMTPTLFNTFIFKLFVPSSFVPPKDIRMLRELVRYRFKLIGHRSSEKNRLQNALTVSNIALASVVSDSFGKSASSIIEYILTCDTFDPEYCKSLLHKSLYKKADEVIQSIIGYELRDDQSVKLKVCRKHYDFINQCVSDLDKAISQLAKPYQDLIDIAVTLPGITEKSATYIIAEIGTDMTVFKSDKHLCSWAGLTPQNNESAGKKKSVHV
ncbi:hypothetical protein Teth514_1905 [Thermoanaerobacter sp. X514]|nr:hypothetical protein Teth514_1905 [Thermoanaerobacter sp. X514]